MDEEELKYLLALSLVPNVGPVLAKNLVAHCGSAENVFKRSMAGLLKVPGFGPATATSVTSFNDFDRAEQEITFIKKQGIQVLPFYGNNYPQRMKRNPDAPLLLYLKGNANLNHGRIISMVGTRKCSEYGIRFCETFISDLKKYHCHVISGLAYGIDIHSHKAALNHDICTIGVVAHGLDDLYPSAHRETVNRMVRNGGILTEYISGTKPDRENFPNRNRIVAGLCDATVVVESAKKGGAMITAELAHSYNRDVFAVPGRYSDPSSAGTNYLIKANKASLLESAADLAFYMGWDLEKEAREVIQAVLPLELTTSEKRLMELFAHKEQWHIDELNFSAEISSSDLALTLLELELKGLVKTLPGKRYQRRY